MLIKYIFNKVEFNNSSKYFAKHLYRLGVLVTTFGTYFKQMKSARKCMLCCIQNSHNPINLPNNVPTIIGRCKETGITDFLLSREQVKLTANLEECTVSVVPTGVNPCGVNGYCLMPYRQYILRHKDRLELLLDQYIHEIIFEPEPESYSSKGRSKRTSSSESGVPVKKQKIDTPKKNSVDQWEEVDDKKLMIFTAKNVEPREKIAGYDMDGTIITTKSGAKFPKDAEDWKFAFSEVPKKLRELHNNDYKVVFFTNQAGVSLGKVKMGDLKQKIEAIISKLDIPIQVFASTGKGVYRKPAPGMWDALCNEKNGEVKVDLKNSFYCGDAAGREKNWAPKMKKDHSVGDRLFSLNIGIPFKTPEEHFLGGKHISGTMPDFDPRKRVKVPLLVPESSKLHFDNQEVIVFVGSPGSGKSHFCKNLLETKGYTHVNRDRLGSWQKCVTAVEAALQKKQSVVIDNTNPDKESRKRYIEVAKKYGVPCRCFVMNTSIHQAKHNNLFREIIDKNHQKIPDIIINSYKNKFVEPTVTEGFTEIVKVNCVPKFDNADLEQLYHMFLLEK